MRLAKAINIDDVRLVARRRLPRKIFDVIDGGHGDDVTLHDNRSAFERIRFRPRALADVASLDTRVTVLGKELASPVLLAPCGFARLCDPQAELAVARAAGRHGVEYVVSGSASESVEDIARAGSGSLWYQIYLKTDPILNDELISRAERAGYRVLCVTIDTPAKPHRETDLRNGLTMPVTITPKNVMMSLSKPRWAKDFLMGNRSSGHSLTAARASYDRFASSIGDLRAVTGSDVRWLRERWKGPLVVKGVLRPDEIDDLVGMGVDGVVVSNHGGRNLDGTPATIDVLPSVAEAARGRMEVFLDGGIRRGADVVKALALGANAVLIGRPYMFGLAAGGEAGVERVIRMIRSELEISMTFVGAASVADIDSSLVMRKDSYRQ